MTKHGRAAEVRVVLVKIKVMMHGDTGDGNCYH